MWCCPSSPYAEGYSPGRLEPPEETKAPDRVQSKASRLLDIAALSVGLRSEADDGSRRDSMVLKPGAVTGWWCLEVWDVFIVVLALVVAYYEPYAAALYAVGREPPEFVAVNHWLTVSFTLDIFAHFFIAEYQPEDSLHKDLWDTSPAKIARRYCAVPCSNGGRDGWFWFDVLSVAPGWICVFLVGDNSSNPALLLRLLRLGQSMRVSRMCVVAERLHARFGLPLLMLEAAKFVAITTLACHWMACMWVLVEGKVTHGLISYNTNHESWLSALLAAKGDALGGTEAVAHDRICVYALAYYWVAMTLTGVGYGDITPQNKMEYIISTFSMLAIGYVWAFIVASILSILQKLDPHSAEFKVNLDSLCDMARRRNLPYEVQVKLRIFMHETQHCARHNKQRLLLEQYLSKGLQREVAAQSVEIRSMLKGVFWMSELPEDAMLDIVRALRPRAIGPQEYINMPQVMFIVQKGLVGLSGRIYSRGDVWGQTDILLETADLLDSGVPRTLGFVELLLLEKQALIDVCRDYPVADRRLRRAQIRTAVARAFVRAAQRTKRMRMMARERTSIFCSAGRPRQRDDCLSSFVSPGRPNLKWTTCAETIKEISVAELGQLVKRVLQTQDHLDWRFQQLASVVAEVTESCNEHRLPSQDTAV